MQKNSNGNRHFFKFDSIRIFFKSNIKYKIFCYEKCLNKFLVTLIQVKNLKKKKIKVTIFFNCN